MNIFFKILHGNPVMDFDPPEHYLNFPCDRDDGMCFVDHGFCGPFTAYCGGGAAQ